MYGQHVAVCEFAQSGIILRKISVCIVRGVFGAKPYLPLSSLIPSSPFPFSITSSLLSSPFPIPFSIPSSHFPLPFFFPSYHQAACSAARESGEWYKLPQQGPGQNPAANAFWGILSPENASDDNSFVIIFSEDEVNLAVLRFVSSFSFLLLNPPDFPTALIQSWAAHNWLDCCTLRIRTEVIR